MTDSAGGYGTSEVLLNCERPGTLPGLGGEQIHGMLFELIRGIAGDSAGAVHGTYPKPFSIGGLRPAQGNMDGDAAGPLTLQEHSDYVFSVCSLSQPMYQVLRGIADAWPGWYVSLGLAKFIAGRAWEEEQLTTDYGSLLELRGANLDGAAPRILFSFTSPTGFRRRGEQVLFPLPELVIRSLVSRWNAFAPDPLSEDFLDVDKIAYSILITRYRLQTEVMGFSRFMLLGFVGDVTYLVNHEVPKLLSGPFWPYVNIRDMRARVIGCQWAWDRAR